MESNQSYNAAQRTDSDQTLTTSTTGTTPPPIRPVPIENPSAPRPVDPGVRDYVMSRFIAAHCFFDHTLDETIGIVGGIDERHRCASFTVREKIQQLRELMLARSLISDTDNTFAQLLDEFERVDELAKVAHKRYYVDRDGVLVGEFEDSIFGMRSAAAALNEALVRCFRGHVPDYNRPATTRDEDMLTGRFVLRRIKDIYCEGEQGPLTELVLQYLFPNSPNPAGQQN